MGFNDAPKQEQKRSAEERLAEIMKSFQIAKPYMVEAVRRMPNASEAELVENLMMELQRQS
jgi:hypothetical protein